MSAPKILPWLARKAGVDHEQALILWHQARAEAEQAHGCRISADYHAAAISRFIDALSVRT